MTCPQIKKSADGVLWDILKQYSYGLGVRCPRPGRPELDYGWGGAAGAFLAVIPSLEITFFYVQHVLSSPNQLTRNHLTEAVIQDII